MPFRSRESCAMSGERYLLDTNAVVALLRGNQVLQQRLQNADWVGISVLSEIEFLAFPDLSSQDRQAFRQFAGMVEVVGIEHSSSALVDRIVSLRQKHKLKLPDAIIAATALEAAATLITQDAQLLKLIAVTSIGIH
jgi:tRNA(fMet)-specific endonuclease VapC